MFYPGRPIKDKRSQYKHLRKQLQQVGTPSSRRKLKRIGERENRWMTDVNHRISKALVNQYDPDTLFVVEDLTGVRTVTERVRVRDRYETVSWSFYQLRKMIEYKASAPRSQSDCGRSPLHVTNLPEVRSRRESESGQEESSLLLQGMWLPIE